MPAITIYHNGECSKCRGALEILQEKGVPHQVRWYMAEPLSLHELTTLLRRLQLPVTDMIRTGEPVYKEVYEGRSLGEAEWLQALISHPELLQRPVVTYGDSAIIARPPERIYEVLAAVARLPPSIGL